MTAGARALCRAAALAGVIGAALSACALAAPAGTMFYVSPAGRDTWSGRRAAPAQDGSDGPFATLDHARDAVRALRKAGKIGKGGATIILRGGFYPRDRALELGPEDSGNPGAPLVIRAYPNEIPRLYGGREVKTWRPVSDPEVLARLDPSVRNLVLEADLNALGLTDYGTITNGGQGRQAQPEEMSVLWNDKAQPLARWPNFEWARIAGTPAGQNGDRFQYDGDRPTRWKSLDDVWVYGYWTYDWADSYEKVTAVDSAAHAFVTAPPLPVYGYTKGRRFIALNVLEELDSPGEWYVDRHRRMLYLYPPTDILKARVVVTTLKEPLISVRNASNIRVEGLTLEATRGDAVQITGGDHVELAGCTVRNAGRYGVVLDGGTENGVRSCNLYDLGEGGIVLNGGDRKTLAPGKLYAINNDIHHFANWFRTYRPGVSLGGVGNVVSHNRIHDAPHSAIQGGGNEHLIEYNDIYRVCTETGDAGAFYMGRDFTQRGNVIRYNYFHHLRQGGIAGTEGFSDVMAVYLDDCLSGETIFGNIFYKAGRAAMIGGGRDNSIENNIFVDCSPAIHVDARGKGWASFWFNGKDPSLMNGLKAVNYSQPPYSVRYPQLAKVLEDDPAMPKGNRIIRNIFYRGKWREMLDNLTDKDVLFQDNLTDGGPGFVDIENENFRLKPDSPAWKLGFQRIPVDKIGLTKDAYRRSLPVRD